MSVTLSFGLDALGPPTDISANGRYLVFDSDADNLVPGDGNSADDVFLRDTLNNTTTLLSRASGALGVIGNGASDDPTISADGRYVTFESIATSLVVGDGNNVEDVFLRDIQTNTTTLLSRASGIDGVIGNGSSDDAVIAAGGRYIVFESAATNLVAGDNNNADDVFLRDTLNNTTTLLSRASGADGVAGNAESDDADISADGRYIVFVSDASNLATGDGNNASDVFLRDTQTNTTTLLSRGTDGLAANGASYDAEISADGRTVLFRSLATNLVPGQVGGGEQIFLVHLPGLVQVAGPVWGQTFFGGYGDDQITITGGSNIAFGRHGNDVIWLDGYSNRIDGGDGDDIVSAGQGGSTVDGGAGDDAIGADGWGNRLIGGAGNDTIDGGQGSARIDAGAGDNHILVRGWSNEVQAANGDNFVQAEAGGGNTIRLGDGNNTLESWGSGNLAVVGNSNSSFDLGDGDNRIFTRGLNNTVTLGDGNNRIEDFDGSATISAGNGSNTILLHGFGNLVTLGSGANQVTVSGGGNNSVTAGGNTVTLGVGAAGNTAIFSALVTGYRFDGISNGPNGDGLAVISPGQGSTLNLLKFDKLLFANGFDIATYASSTSAVTARLDFPSMNTGDAAGDNYTGVSGLIGSKSNDFLVGKAGANLLVGLDGDDKIAGEAGNDTIFGGNGQDQFWGGEGADALDGGLGYDIARYDNAASGVVARLDGGLNGGEAAGDTFTGIEALYGSAFGDVLIGGATGDVLVGLNGGDLLYGLGGNDLLFGGGGIDAFAFNTAGFGTDVVMDFKTSAAAGADHDYVDFRGIPGLSAFALSQVGADTHVVTNHGTVILQNILASTLAGDDFLF